jgi:hypothetical protein
MCLVEVLLYSCVFPSTRVPRLCTMVCPVDLLDPEDGGDMLLRNVG